MEKIEDFFYDAVSTGVNHNTVIFLNGSLVGCIITLTALFFIALAHYPGLAQHVAFMAAFALGLLVLINWFIKQVGTIEPAQQRAQVLGSAANAPAAKASAAQQDVAVKEGKKAK